jgi:hypothetical protein
MSNEINMKHDKSISGQIVRKNREHKGMWDLIETRAGQPTGKASYTGSMKEIRGVIKAGHRLFKARS